MKNYQNSIIEYTKTRNKVAITYIIYSTLGIMLFSYLSTIAIIEIVKLIAENNRGLIIILSILALLMIAVLGLLIAAFIVYFIVMIKNNKTIKYYKNIELTNITEMIIPYDYKLWLTAPKDTFHPISLKFTINNEEKQYKTAIIFTNSKKYNVFPKLKMPDILLAKNYVTNYAIVGYNKEKDECIILGYRKPVEK